jgi:hypothetical protein
VALLREHGCHDRAAQAEFALPERLDTKKDHDELTRFGITAVDVGKGEPELLPPYGHSAPTQVPPTKR